MVEGSVQHLTGAGRGEREETTGLPRSYHGAKSIQVLYGNIYNGHLILHF